MRRAVSEEPIQFSREVVVSQLAARSSLRQGLVAIVLCLLVSWLMAYLAATRLGLSDGLWLVAMLLLLAVAFIAARQWQWSVLATQELRCPSCRHLLIAERRWWSSPSPFCKACGKLAILPNRILDQAADT
jgi:positive regulator of sigma E activity